jgi:Zn-dependent M16 (insulinase) family peptidase
VVPIDKQVRIANSYLIDYPDVISDNYSGYNEAKIQKQFDLKILSYLLTDGPTSPFHKALLDTQLGADFVVGTGLNTSSK